MTLRSSKNYTRPTRREYVIIVAIETIWQSFTSDVLTVLVIATPIAINEMTIRSTLMNFVFGILLFLTMVLKVTREENKRKVIGRTREELVENLLSRIDQLERKD